MRPVVSALLVVAVLLSGCGRSSGHAAHTEGDVHFIKADFDFYRRDEGVSARWVNDTSTSVRIHVRSRHRSFCDAFVRGNYRISGQGIRVELVNGPVDECERIRIKENGSVHACQRNRPIDLVLDTEIMLVEPAVNPARDVEITVVVTGGPTYITTLSARG